MINIFWKKLILKFSSDKENDVSNNQNMNWNSLTKEKNKSTKFFQKIQNRNFSQTPVFSFFMALIIFINFLIFVSGFLKIFDLEGLSQEYFPLFFGANHSSSIIEGKQVWRIISFPFVEDSTSLNVVFVAFFIWLTYWKIGYYQEIFLGSKKVALIYGIGIPIIGFSQFLLTKTEALYFYGTEYLSLLGLGALTFHYLIDQEKNEQSKGLIRSMVWKSIIIIFIFGIIKYVKIFNNVENKALLEIANYYFIYPVLAFLIGFFLCMMINYKTMLKNAFAFYIGIGFFIILVLAWAITGYSLLTEINLGDNTWKIIEKYY